ncbi:hypothetical protein TrVE_jg866 [Triparma verrucosa]|uniref:Uncharacterized protein n=1 Tax=Triparma verrucosa TaxID=1606542 RepID=A0A9W7EU88_9STRA|nr:hypothetical protein TrVE_jg866 [Triparma verrucosa]
MTPSPFVQDGMTSYLPVVTETLEPMVIGSTISSLQSPASTFSGLFQSYGVFGCFSDLRDAAYGFYCFSCQYGDSEARALGLESGNSAPGPYRVCLRPGWRAGFCRMFGVVTVVGIVSLVVRAIQASSYDLDQAYQDKIDSGSVDDDFTPEEWKAEYLKEQPGFILFEALFSFTGCLVVAIFLVRQIKRVRGIIPSFANAPSFPFSSLRTSDYCCSFCCPFFVGCWISRALIEEEEK